MLYFIDIIELFEFYNDKVLKKFYPLNMQLEIPFFCDQNHLITFFKSLHIIGCRKYFYFSSDPMGRCNDTNSQ